MSENENKGCYVGLTVPVNRERYQQMLITIKRQHKELTCWRITALVLTILNMFFYVIPWLWK